VFAPLIVERGEHIVFECPPEPARK